MNDYSNRDARIRLTSKCNYKCFFCHEEGGCKTSAADWTSTLVLLRALKAQGRKEITFTGGEPLLNKPVTLLKDVATAFEKRIAELKKAVSTSQEMTRDAPGRIESRYDTSREETGWLTTGLGVVLGEMEHNYALFKCIPPRPMSMVMTGACFEAVTLDGGTRVRCLVCPGGSGLECESEGQVVTLVSPESPLAAGAFGKSAHDVFTVNNRIDYQILSVA